MKRSLIKSGRTRFGNIVAEFWEPSRPSRKAIILCDGCPTMPSKRKVGEFFARKGYWVFHPRYRGTWESGGKFLEYAPDEDVLLVARGIRKKFRNVYDDSEYVLAIDEIIAVGVSFGGAAAILSTRSPLITKAVALSPIIDWKARSKAEPFAYFIRLIKEGFGEGYRVHKSAWRRLQRGTFYSPKHDMKRIDPLRLFVIHTIDDDVVPIAPLRAFAKKTKLKPLVLRTGGHLSLSAVMDPHVWKQVNIFLKKK